ncbi:MAG: protoporphyrinogen oxidase [Verrucomicrobia bacterium]|nr:protoporphyrinogen oxidase [Verrucomicrobiota bacterium]
MGKQRALILGGGISGLAAAWYLSRKAPSLDVILLETTDRLGGWMHTDHTTGFHFEKGPRTLRCDRSPCTLEMAKDLGLDLVWSNAKDRYLYLHGKLQHFPTSPWEFLFSPLTKGWIFALLTEWKREVKRGDESIWDFTRRRFGLAIAEKVFDPLVVGIFGGDAREISVEACFPKLKAWEEEYGSITKGLWKRKKGGGSKEIFSFRAGMEELVHALSREVSASIRLKQDVQQIGFSDGGVEVRTQDQHYVADYLFCALPADVAARLLKPHVPEASRILEEIPLKGIAVVNAGYHAQVLPVRGFGYLTPTYMDEEILGVIFDSSVFREHNQREEETRLTINLKYRGWTEEEYLRIAREGLMRQLRIERAPDVIVFKDSPRAIPQYLVGHMAKMKAAEAALRERLPRCAFLGNYWQGISVEHCVALAKQKVNAFVEQEDGGHR